MAKAVHRENPLHRAEAVLAATVLPRAWGSHVLVTAVWALAVLVSSRLEITGAPRQVALAVHIVGLALGIGPVMLIDWYGLVWMAGLRSFRDCLRLAEAANPLIWLGICLLLSSGALLALDLASPLSWFKQALVLLLVNNGVALRSLSGRLRHVSPPASLSDLSRPLRLRVIATLALAQATWWGAAVLGFISTATRAHIG